VAKEEKSKGKEKISLNAQITLHKKGLHSQVAALAAISGHIFKRIVEYLKRYSIFF
jgi:hypothetical protein